MNTTTSLATSSIVAACALATAGCATSPPPRPTPLITQATALLGRPSVSSWGQNWQIESLAEDAGRRFTVYTYASDCSDRAGKLFFRTPYVAKDVYANGATAEDKLFAKLCQAGMPIAYQNERSRPKTPDSASTGMSPQERAVMLQHLLNQAMPQQQQPIETKCERTINSPTGQIVCVSK
jgi:hypothetical protein